MPSDRWPLTVSDRRGEQVQLRVESVAQRNIVISAKYQLVTVFGWKLIQLCGIEWVDIYLEKMDFRSKTHCK